MPLRVECSVPDLEGNWLDVSETWALDELRAYLALKGDEFIALWQRKIVACHLLTVGGEFLTDPATVYPRLGELDLRLVNFVRYGPLEATDYLMTLGEVNKRLSFAGAGEAARTTKTTTAPG